MSLHLLLWILPHMYCWKLHWSLLWFLFHLWMMCYLLNKLNLHLLVDHQMKSWLAVLNMLILLEEACSQWRTLRIFSQGSKVIGLTK